MGRVEIWKARWGFFVDNIFLYVGDTANWRGFQKNRSCQRPRARSPDYLGNSKTYCPTGSLTVGGRYLLGTLPLSPEKPLPVVSFELLGGGRYVWFNQYTSLAVDATLTGPLGQAQITRGKSFTCLSP